MPINKTPPPPNPNTLAANIASFVFANAGREVPAVPCREQMPYRTAEGKYVPVGGELSKYPKVRPAASSTRTP